MGYPHWRSQHARRLAQTITTQHDEAAHNVCLDGLEAYITAQIAGQDYLALFPSVARHLDSCVACAELYGLVYESRVTEASSLIAISVPEPDLQFLRAAPAELLQRRIAAAVERFGAQRLRFTLSQALLDLFAPQSVPAFALRGAAGDTPLLDVTVGQAAADDVQIQLTVYPRRDTLDLCTVRSRVMVAGREWPDLVEIPVTLTVGGSQRQVYTDPWGEAIFDDVPKVHLAGLQIDVAVGDAPQTST
jgi:hypothetical protein